MPSPRNNGNRIPSLPLTDGSSRNRHPWHPANRPSIDQRDFSGNSTSAQPLLHGEQDSSESGDDRSNSPAKGTKKPQRPFLNTDPARRTSSIAENEGSPSSPPPKEGPVAWRDLPKKGQLAILTLARLSEPLTQASIQAYMVYQVKSFDPSLPDSTISSQVGILQGCFTVAQFLTAFIWGRIADADWAGRKRVMMIGLMGTTLSSVGYGFSRTFVQAAIFRTLGGMLNGNVGVIRTMVSEIVKEKKYQSRAFLILPMCFNIGVIIGPILGGLLADPVRSYPRVFGANSLLGGKDGVWWLKHWPYVLPNLMTAGFLFLAFAVVVLGLEETLESLRDEPDLGLRMGRSMARCFLKLIHPRTHDYTALSPQSPLHSTRPQPSYELESPLQQSPETKKPKIRAKLPFRRIFTPNVLLTLLSHSIMALHIGTFNSLWFIHLSTPRYDPQHPSPPWLTHPHFPFTFTGGLGLPPRTIGLALSILGFIGITLQLLIYPSVNAKLGTLTSFRWFTPMFPLAYTLAPYLSLIPGSKSSPPPGPASGVRVWLGILLVLTIQVIGRTFALPATIILINNCAPHPSVLGTVHGIAQSIGSLSRTVGPVLGGWGFGMGLEGGVVGAVWWALAVVAIVGWWVSWAIKEGGEKVILDEEETTGDDGEPGEEALASDNVKGREGNTGGGERTVYSSEVIDTGRVSGRIG